MSKTNCLLMAVNVWLAHVSKDSSTEACTTPVRRDGPAAKESVGMKRLTAGEEKCLYLDFGLKRKDKNEVVDLQKPGDVLHVCLSTRDTKVFRCDRLTNTLTAASL